MPKLKKKIESDYSAESLITGIAQSDAWLVVTISRDKDGANVAVRESEPNMMAKIVALLLEEKELYKAIQSEIARLALIDKKNKKLTNKNVN